MQFHFQSLSQSLAKNSQFLCFLRFGGPKKRIRERSVGARQNLHSHSQPYRCDRGALKGAPSHVWATPPVRLGFFGRNSGKTLETLSERFLEFPSGVRLGSPQPYNSRHLRLPEHFQNSLPASTAGDASVFQQWFRRGPPRAGHGIPSSTGGMSECPAAVMLQRVPPVMVGVCENQCTDLASNLHAQFGSVPTTPDLAIQGASERIPNPPDPKILKNY